MHHEFWLERWQKNEIGFHQELINPWLSYYYGEVGPPDSQRADLCVFVPLCGKSRDMLWLAQNGYHVVGLEISEKAVNDFFTESELLPVIEEHPHHTQYDAGTIKVLQGDIFACDSTQLANITDVFDRAALIALPEAMRIDYANHMAALLQPGTRILLVTMTYPQEEMDGPPFSVSEEEVSELFSDNFSIDKLALRNILDDEPRFKERGLTSLVETAYRLKRK